MLEEKVVVKGIIECIGLKDFILIVKFDDKKDE